MLKIKFKNSTEFTNVEFSIVTVKGYTVVQLIGSIPKNKSGFEVSRENGDVLGDYVAFTSIYKELENGLQFSEADLKPWIPPAPTAAPEPPTQEEVAEREKQARISDLQSQILTLKQQIDSTDYKIIKCFEYGSVNLESPYDSTKLHEERQVLRDKINYLEIELEDIDKKK